MTLEHRVAKLEQATPNTDNAPDVIFLIGAGNPHASAALLVVPPFGSMNRSDGEPANDFYRRVYAAIAGGKHIEVMTDEERAAAYAMADEKLANEAAQ
ncbi:hypothetical protein [Tropicimonas sp. IMCC6043]|uniref:hypothetical protein n=1 Tax=Tropicimonas sp. IMCC6043 TaxID=2510645 RepID=UPI00101C41A7|nr:hypothetical protein [Tropicimonas sp. IMCC6043]RYH08823.1 hypothetical protein EU800_15190 [Tropicimonas sp. IMCC6043]